MIGHVGELASAYLDGETTPDESDRLRAHLTDCLACQAEVADIHAARSALRAMPILELPEGLLDDFGLVAPIIPLRRRPPILIGAAAAALILFVTFAALLTPNAVGVPLDDISKQYQEQTSLGSAIAPNVGALRPEELAE